VTLALMALAAAPADAWTPTTPDWLRGLAATIVVVALAGACAWLLRRGKLGPLGRRRDRLVTTEIVAMLGERRSLVVATVEGRRLLLGVTPAQISLVAELNAAVPFDRRLEASVGRHEEKTA